VADGYKRPAAIFRTELIDNKSRFIATIGMVETVDAARVFLAEIGSEMSDASHHVYAYRVGHGSSVIESLSDAGEPSGTAGQPVMAVLRGSGLGDAMITVTRYWGGIKLGTGGLVRAYTDAAKAAVTGVAVEVKIARVHLLVVLSYPLYERAVRIARALDADIEGEDYAADVTLTLQLPQANADLFEERLRDLSAGSAQMTRL
jgi:uncharacterized YigZ family protein